MIDGINITVNAGMSGPGRGSASYGEALRASNDVLPRPSSEPFPSYVQLAALLSDGTIRLLSCAWLRVQPELPLQRCQDLPEEAFLPPAIARQLYERCDRSVAVLSYRWSDYRHPDIEMRTLRKVQAHLRVARYEGLFWDFTSMPQPRWLEEEERLALGDRSEAEGEPHRSDALSKFRERAVPLTPDEESRQKRGLYGMDHLYGSLHATAVLQIKAAPDSGEHLYDNSGW